MPLPPYPPGMRRLINELSKLPTIGERSAFRLAYYLLSKDPAESIALSDAIKEARLSTRFCTECFSLSEAEICAVCTDTSRDRSLICVVEKAIDTFAIERSGRFRGLYHVLHGLWSPMRGTGPEQIKIPELLARIARGKLPENTPVQEVVLATGATIEGDATALYLAKRLKDAGVKVTRIAQGLPKGGELQYADDLTLTHALEGRSLIKD